MAPASRAYPTSFENQKNISIIKYIKCVFGNYDLHLDFVLINYKFRNIPV